MFVYWPCIQEKCRRESTNSHEKCRADTDIRDMANIEVDWEVEGIISPEESVTKMLKVFSTKGKEQSGTFWSWDNRVRTSTPVFRGRVS